MTDRRTIGRRPFSASPIAGPGPFTADFDVPLHTTGIEAVCVNADVKSLVLQWMDSGTGWPIVPSAGPSSTLVLHVPAGLWIPLPPEAATRPDSSVPVKLRASGTSVAANGVDLFLTFLAHVSGD